jgi:hypothetical protein
MSLSIPKFTALRHEQPRNGRKAVRWQNELDHFCTELYRIADLRRNGLEISPLFLKKLNISSSKIIARANHSKPQIEAAHRALFHENPIDPFHEPPSPIAPWKIKGISSLLLVLMLFQCMGSPTIKHPIPHADRTDLTTRTIQKNLKIPSLPKITPVELPKYFHFNHPGSHAGMFSTCLSLLGMLDRYETNPGKFSGLEIDFGTNGIYYDPNLGNNWWEYYFKPIRHIVKEGETYYPSKLDRWHFANCAESNFRGQGIKMPREVGNALFHKYFILRPEIQKSVQDFADLHFKNKYVISVHYRGGDKVNGALAEANKVSYQEMLREVESQIEKNKNYVIFLASDEQPFIEFMRERFGSKVVATDIPRNTHHNSLHHHHPVSPYQSGKDAIVDCMLLARGDVLIRTSSNLSLFSTYINPKMPVIELSQRLDTDHAKNILSILKNGNYTC